MAERWKADPLLWTDENWRSGDELADEPPMKREGEPSGTRRVTEGVVESGMGVCSCADAQEDRDEVESEVIGR